jgi:hypothetical protein
MQRRFYSAATGNESPAPDWAASVNEKSVVPNWAALMNGNLKAPDWAALVNAEPTSLGTMLLDCSDGTLITLRNAIGNPLTLQMALVPEHSHAPYGPSDDL